MRVLYEWFMDACMKPKMQQTPADELIITLFPLLVVGIVAIIICAVAWIVSKLKGGK